MAQWIGQFSGATHATKVRDLEASLRVAVTAFKSTVDVHQREAKAKAVRHLSRRLLSARLHLIGSRLVKAKEKQAEEESALLQERHLACQQGGVESILAEFGFDEHAANS